TRRSSDLGFGCCTGATGILVSQREHGLSFVARRTLPVRLAQRVQPFFAVVTCLLGPGLPGAVEVAALAAGTATSRAAAATAPAMMLRVFIAILQKLGVNPEPSGLCGNGVCHDPCVPCSFSSYVTGFVR